VLRKFMANNTFTEGDELKANLVIKHEPSSAVRVIYSSLLARCDLKTYRIHLYTVQNILQQMMDNIAEDTKL
jgi:hypothetical protein